MAESAILVRPVEPEDWADIADIFEQPRVIAGTMQLPFRTRAWRRKRLDERDPANSQLGAVIDGKLIGVTGLERPVALRRAHVGSLFLAVQDAYEGRGAGSALMQALLDLADRWLNIRRMELTVYADNARAIGLYEKHGFVREGLHQDFAFRDGAFVSALAMARLRPR
jgi:putative acetyltransferase